MAPFDPLQLLKLLSPLLSVEGGIKSADEVPRLSSLMKKFSKKLVSRCVYCNVLKATKTDVLNAFLDLEGWMTINMWLVDARDNKNDAFLEELLLLCKELPMTVNRLKQNNTAKLVKTLTKVENPCIRKLSYKLVESWMKLIKGATTPLNNVEKPNADKAKKKKPKKEGEEVGKTPHSNKEDKVTSKGSPPKPPYDEQEDVEYEPDPPEEKVKLKEPRPKTVKTLQTRFRSTGLIEETPLPKAVTKKPVLPVIDRDVVVAAAKKRMSTNHPSFPEKKVKPSSLIMPASDTTNGPGIKLIPPKPRPVHILHESAGFMDALDAAPVQPLRKKKTRKTPTSPTTPPATSATAPPKLQFYKDTLELGEGKPKTEEPSTPEATPDAESQESVAEEKKPTPPPPQPPAVETPVEEPVATGPVLRRSPRGKKKLEDEQKRLEEEIKKKKLEEEEDSEATEEEDYSQEAEGDAEDSEATQEGDEVPMDVDDKASTVTTGESQEAEEEEMESSGNEPKKVKSILMLTRRKDKKKSVRWVEDDNLKQFFFFELDENERVNVNNVRNFGDLKNLEMKRERMAFETARRRISDNMSEGIPWRHLVLVDLPPPLVDPGSSSKEKEIQMLRQKTTLEEIYFNREMLPETPHEPDTDLSSPAPQEPILIPIEDLTNPGVLMDYSTMDLPIPKAALPPVLTNLMMSIASPFANNEDEVPHMGGINEAPMGDPFVGDMAMPIVHQEQFPPMMMPQPQQPPAQQQPPPQQMMQGPQMMGPAMWTTGGNGHPPPPGGPMGQPDWGGPMVEPMGMFGGGPPPEEMMGNNRGPPHDMGFGGMPPQQDMFPGPQQGMRPMRGGGKYMGEGRHQRPPHRGQHRGNSWRPPPRVLCKHYVAGTCRFGANCNFLHPGINGPPV